MAEPDCNPISKEPISTSLLCLARRVARGLLGSLITDSFTLQLVVCHLLYQLNITILLHIVQNLHHNNTVSDS
jgi:hypothetical protein